MPAKLYKWGLSREQWLARPGSHGGSSGARADWRRKRIAEGRCVTCGDPRGETGTATRCADCNSAINAAKRRNVAEPFELVCMRRLGPFIAELDRHVENIYDCRELWTKRRIMREGELEVRR